MGGYEAQEQASAKADNFYDAFATLLNCAASEIAYAENATRAWNLLFHALPLKPGDRILTGQSEYASNYIALLHMAKQRNIQIEVIANNSDGQICLEQLERRIDSDVRLIALTHVPSQSGVIHPAEQVGHLARRYNIFYLLDACQSAGQLELDVQRIGCDMLTGTGRKYLRGPRGTGFMYVRRAILDQLQPQFADQHAAHWVSANDYAFRDDARRFECWESFLAGRIALGTAVDYACALGMNNIQHRVQHLASQLREQLRELPQVLVHDQGNALSGIVTFSRPDENAATLHRRLQLQGINTSIIRRSGALLDFERRTLGDINRASVHYYNTEDEITRFCRAVAES
jgi:cysteine desulfurase / selenocysteine lyase